MESVPCLVNLHEGDVACGKSISTRATNLTSDLARSKSDPGRGHALFKFCVELMFQLAYPSFVTLQ